MLLFGFGLVDGEIGEWEWDYFWWGPLGSVFESLVLLTMIVACSKNHVATTLTWGDNESGKFDLDLVLGRVKRILFILRKSQFKQLRDQKLIKVQHQASQPLFDTRKAFTGSIIEDAENIQNNCKRTKFNFITV
ncbi:hypothetical protein GLYMA_17G167766v4 [Glycine max]|nr:hypothetical protein GLYMA_17G167766v4 [Glycine max]KAH1118783.1 hypothetical protein GYH30_047531 [Glycine max]